MGLLNKTNKTDIISTGVFSYGWCGEFIDDKKRVKKLELIFQMERGYAGFSRG